MASSGRPSRRFPAFPLKPLVAACLLAGSVTAHAVTRYVSTEAELAAAITEMNLLPGANFIEFDDDIRLTGDLPPIISTITIKGHGKTLSGDTDDDGQPDVQLLVVGSNSAPGTSVLVQITGLTLDGGLAKGANGTGGGDGADGTGGALQINSNADVVLKDVKIRNSGAVGGNGDATDGNGGNALGGGIYVAAGGRLSLSGTADPDGDPLAAVANLGAGAVVGGQGQGAGSNGIGAGDGLFLEGSGTLRLTTNPNTVLKLEGGISDSAGVGLGTGTWNLLLEGGGGAPTDTTDPTADLNFGTIVLGGTNTYGGDTYISDVNVGIVSMGALGTGGVVALDNGGLVVAAGVDVNRELVLASGGGRIGVYSGEGTLSGDVTGRGNLMKVGAGDLELLGNSNFDGDWRVREGALVIDSNSRLGSRPNLILDGGGIRFSADVADMRSFDLTTRNGYIDNGGNDVVLAGAINGWDGLVNDVTLTFRDSGGGGITTLADGHDNGSGKTHIESGTVIGNIARGALTVDAGALFNLGAANRTVGALLGDGKIETNGQRLTINLDEKEGASSPVFAGEISGSGSVTIANTLAAGSFVWNLADFMDMSLFKAQALTGTNTYTGGTTVSDSALLRISDPANLGTGALTLSNGALETSASSLDIDINLAGSVGILQTTADLDFNGHLLGSADFLKTGAGTMMLNNANTGFTGNIAVQGAGSYVALADAGALGTGDLVLSQGGGLKLLADTAELRPVKIASGVGVIHTDDHVVRSSGNITGPTGLAALVTTGRLRKEGTGDLILTGSVTLNGGLEIAEGTVQLGDGGTTGSFSSGSSFCLPILGCPPEADIYIEAGAALVVNRSNNLSLGDPITGGGQVVKRGAGVLTLEGSNTFSGGLSVFEGYVTSSNPDSYGFGTILLDGGGLRLGSDLYRDVELGANNGRLQVTGGTPRYFGGQLLGNGDLVKTGAGTLIYTGVASADIQVQEGVFQVGEGYVGTLLSNVTVDAGAELAFGREDLSQYNGVVSGAGDVVKRGIGELVLTGDQEFTGNLRIENGILRLGNGGTSGSLKGGADIATGAELIVSRSNTAEITGSLQGGGTLRQAGLGQLRLPGDSSGFLGNTVVENGSLRIDGILGGDVDLLSGTRLQGDGGVGGNLTLMDNTVFAPGNNYYGEFTVGGNLALNNDSQLRIDIDETGLHDKVMVTGTASLAGTLRVMPQFGTYLTPGCCTYTILEATGGLNGTEFGQVSNDLAFLDIAVNYLSDRVNVSVARNGNGFGSLSDLSWNQQQVSSALDVIASTQDPANPYPLVQLVELLTDAEARAAYDSLSGDSLLAQANMAASVSRRFNHLLSARSSRLGLASRSRGESMDKSLAAVREGRMPEAPAAFTRSLDPLHYDGPTSAVEGLWLEAAGFRLNEDSDSVVGSAASSLSGNLLALGADGYWSDSTIVGFGLGYLQGDLGFDNRQSEGDVSGIFAGLYTRWETRAGWHYKATFALGQQDTDQTRTVVVGGSTSQAASTSTVTTANAGLEMGLALHLGSYGMRPYATVDLQYLKRDAIEETGTGPGNLSVAATDDTLGEFGVGIEFSRPWLTDGARWAQLQSSVALLLPFGSTQREQSVHFSGVGTSYSVKATPNDTPALQFTLGGEWYLSPSLALWGGYEGRVSSSTQEHNGVLSIQYRW